MISDVFSGPFCTSDVLGQHTFCDLLVFQINPFTHSHIVEITPAFFQVGSYSFIFSYTFFLSDLVATYSR